MICLIYQELKLLLLSPGTRHKIITPYEDKIYVSARSIDEVNVQLVMEKLGGGGHISIAGAQFTDCTIDQAINKIKLTLDNMIKDGEI